MSFERALMLAVIQTTSEQRFPLKVLSFKTQTHLVLLTEPSLSAVSCEYPKVNWGDIANTDI